MHSRGEESDPVFRFEQYCCDRSSARAMLAISVRPKRPILRGTIFGILILPSECKEPRRGVGECFSQLAAAVL